MFKKLFEKLTKSSNPESSRYRHDMAKQICGHHIRYITEKKNDVDEVIGRDGSLNIKDDCLIVSTPADTILRCRIDEMQAWELLSHDGVVITAPDIEHGGVERTIIVFYVYYR
ncbi:MAG: hypothetical protein MJ192_10615 [Clostridia bacterium]|nr:hypothetical protein [Clostridia bacterium]